MKNIKIYLLFFLLPTILVIMMLQLNASAKILYPYPAHCKPNAAKCRGNGSCAWGTTCNKCCSCAVDNSDILFGWCQGPV